MLKSALVIALTALTASVSFAANSVSVEAQRLAEDIRRESPYLTVEQQSEVMRHLRAARAALYGGPQNDDQGGSYTCVARDNDGRDPYVLAVRQGINVVRIPNAMFSTLSACQAGMSSVRIVRDTALMCLSRDNDGRDPYQIAVINGTSVTRIQRTMTTSLDSCLNLMRSLRFTQGQATFCTSRDNDGRSPFVAAVLDIRSLQIQTGTEVFNSEAQCAQFIGR